MLSGTIRFKSSDGSILKAVALILIPVLLALVVGCATTEGADQPWNTPEPWEAHPGIPGLTDQ